MGWRPGLNLDRFSTLAEAEFRWLIDECGFVVTRRTRIGSRYAGVVLTNATSHVRIGWEPQDFSYLPVDLGSLSAADAVGRHAPGERYPLWLVVWVRSQDKSASTALENARGESKPDVEAALRAASRALWRYGRDILAGDFTSFGLLEAAFDAYVGANARKLEWPDPRSLTPKKIGPD